MTQLTRVKSFSALLLSLMTLCLAAGCGSSSEDLSLGVNSTGSLAYLLRVNNVTTVPNGTATLRFDLYDTANPSQGSLVLTQTLALSDTVTLNDLPTSVSSTVVTALDSNGIPLGQVTVNSQVVTGQQGQVDLSNLIFVVITFDALQVSPDPIEVSNSETQALSLQADFSNGSSLVLDSNSFAASATFLSNDTNIATVGTDGLVSAAGAGNTTLTTTYTLNGVSRSDTVQVNVTTFDVVATFQNARVAGPNEFDDFGVGVGGSSQPTYLARFTGPDSQLVNIPSSQLSFVFQPPVAGFSVSASGQVSVGAQVIGGTTANLQVSYTDSGVTYRDVMVVTAND